MDKEGDGGQRGNPPSAENQQLSLPNGLEAHVDNIGASEAFPTQIKSAARWLFLNRDSFSGPIIPTLRCRFGLSNLEAIAATKMAHSLEDEEAGK